MHKFKLIISSLLILGTILSVSLFTVPTKKAQAYSVKTSHPRIWLTPEILETLKARAKANTKDWTNLKSTVDYYLGSTIHLPDGDYDFSIIYALAYQITGDTRYSDRSIQIAKTIDIPRGDYYFNPAACNMHEGRVLAVPTAITFDWNYDRLTAEDKAFFTSKMAAWADTMTSTACWRGYFGHNYYNDYLEAKGLIALSIFGDHNKAQTYLDNVKSNLENPIFNFLNTYGKGGYWEEGLYYGTSLNDLLRLIEGFKTATGEDLTANLNYFDEWADMFIASLIPGPGGSIYISGDLSGSLGDDNIGIQLMLTERYVKNPLKAQYLEKYLRSKWPEATHNCIQWGYFLWHNPSLVPVDYTSVTPLDYLASGAGLLFSRTSQASPSTFFSFQAGNKVTDHQHMDQGTFFIYHKGTQAMEGNYGTITHNTITVNSTHQIEDSAKAVMTRYEPKADYTYSQGNISEAYYDSDLTKYIRDIVFLKPNYVVTYDRVAAPVTNNKQWNLNSLTSWTINGDIATATNSSGKIYNKSLLPEAKKITSYQLNYEFKPISDWRLMISPTIRQNEDNFLNAIEVADSVSQGMVQTNKIESAEASAVGVQMGDRLVMFGKNGQINGSVTYELASGTGISKQLLTGLRVSFPYTVKINGNTSTMSSTNQGTLAFDITMGTTNNISVVPQDVPAVSVVKSSNKTSAKSGDTITYTLNYSNSGTVGATNAKIEDPIPVNTTFESIVSGGATYDPANNKVILNIGNLAPAATGTIQFKVKVD